MAIKIILVITLLLLFYQDVKHRAVWFFLPPLFLLLGTYLFYSNAEPYFYLYCISINLIVVTAVLAIMYIVSKYLLKKNFFKEAFGVADFIIFYGLALSFPTISFFTFFVFSAISSIGLYLYLKHSNSSKAITAPLAGSISIFLIGVYVSHWSGLYDKMYFL